MPKTSDPDITIMHRLIDQCLYGVKDMQCFKKSPSPEIKLVDVTLCKCSWYILSVLNDLAYGFNERFSIAGKIFQVNPLET